MEAGASGYLLKTSSASEIAEAIRSTYKWRSIFLKRKIVKKYWIGKVLKQKTILHDDLTNFHKRRCWEVDFPRIF